LAPAGIVDAERTWWVRPGQDARGFTASVPFHTGGMPTSIAATLKNVTLGNPQTFQNLALFPLLSAVDTPPDYVTLAGALKKPLRAAFIHLPIRGEMAEVGI
jgi:hypothetical protein